MTTETTGHILFCQEEGRSKLLVMSSTLLLHWMLDLGTERDLTFLIVKFIQGRVSMEEICWGHSLPTFYLPYAKDQDEIGWRRFMEGMVAGQIKAVLDSGGLVEDCSLTAEKWTLLLVQKLLETSHGMWIYCNLMIHDNNSRVLAIARKEKLQEESKQQLELGGDGLCKEDKWMMEVNLDDLLEGTGEREWYWLLAIQTPREHKHLSDLEQQRRCS
ncbi:LOW QUALITY PROTEIN: hypothetical protein ACHAWX_004449 [Stephanocyclus meneghinianus]